MAKQPDEEGPGGEGSGEGGGGEHSDGEGVTQAEGHVGVSDG